MQLTVNGDRGTLHFECHFIDIKTREGRGGHGRQSGSSEDQQPLADHELGREHGRAEDLSRRWRKHTPQQDAAAGRSRRRLLSPADNPLVRAWVGCPPASTPSCSSRSWAPPCSSSSSASSGFACSASRTSGWRRSGRSRSEPLRTASSGATRHVRGLLAQNVGTRLLQGLPRRCSEAGSRRRQPAIDQAITSAVARIAASTLPRHSRLPAFSRGRAVPAQDSCNERPALEGHGRDHRAGRRRSRARRPFACRPS